MIISDLNYMEVATEEVAGSRGTNVNSTGNINFNGSVNFSEDIFKKFTVDVSGLAAGSSVAQVTGTSDAQGGFAQFTNIIFATQAEPGVAESLVNSTAAVRYNAW